MFARDDSEPSNHVSCTIEMANLNKSFDVAVIDEIQMIKDPQRGWAWTRALLGLRAKEIHVCGDGSALDLVAGLSFSTGDDFTVSATNHQHVIIQRSSLLITIYTRSI